MTNTRIARFRIDGARRDKDGFLRCDVNLSRTGVFDYETEDRTLIRELRPPEEVFAEDSLESYLGKPVTVRHPSSFVNPDNHRILSVGSVTTASENEPFVSGQILIHDGKTIKRVESGELTEISMGYHVELDRGDGETHDAVQRQIQINHCALLGEGEGRLGSEVGIMRLDSANNVIIDEDFMTQRTDAETVEDTEDKQMSEEDAPEQEEAAAGDADTEETPEDSDDEEKTDNVEEIAAMLKGIMPALEEVVAYVRSLQEPEEEESDSAENVDSIVEGRVQRALRARAAFSRVFPDEDVDGLDDAALATRVIQHADSAFKPSADDSVDTLVEKASLVAAATPQERNDSSLRERMLGDAPRVADRGDLRSQVNATIEKLLQ